MCLLPWLAQVSGEWSLMGNSSYIVDFLTKPSSVIPLGSLGLKVLVKLPVFNLRRTQVYPSCSYDVCVRKPDRLGLDTGKVANPGNKWLKGDFVCLLRGQNWALCTPTTTPPLNHTPRPHSRLTLHVSSNNSSSWGFLKEHLQGPARQLSTTKNMCDDSPVLLRDDG